MSNPERGAQSPLSTISLKMKRITSHDVVGNPETVAVFRNADKTITCVTPASEAGLNDALLSMLQKSNSSLLPSGNVEVRSDGTLFVEGRFYAPEWHEEVLFGLRKKFDADNGISPSERVLMAGEAKREVLRAGGVLS